MQTLWRICTRGLVRQRASTRSSTRACVYSQVLWKRRRLVGSDGAINDQHQILVSFRLPLCGCIRGTLLMSHAGNLNTQRNLHIGRDCLRFRVSSLFHARILPSCDVIGYHVCRYRPYKRLVSAVGGRRWSFRWIISTFLVGTLVWVSTKAYVCTCVCACAHACVIIIYLK